MLYIKKTLPSKEVAEELSRVRREQRHLIESGKGREAFDCLNKAPIRVSLVKEQHGLCAYCMRRIKDSPDTTIEHWRPINQDMNGALDYGNMLGVCRGGREADEQDAEGSGILCCDAAKGDSEITINPCNPDHIKKIRYSENGRIYTYPEDTALERDINEVLNLNGQEGFDTQTRLIRGRKEAYKSCVRFIESRSKARSLSRSTIEGRISHIESQNIYDEFAGVVLYLLKRKLRQ